jgi:hypothetical protein
MQLALAVLTRHSAPSCTNRAPVHVYYERGGPHAGSYRAEGAQAR